MENAPSVLSRDPPPFPAPPRSIDLSPLGFILALFAVVTIPAMIYVFFLAVNCPPNPFRRRRQSYRSSSSETDGHIGNIEVVTDVKFDKETHAKDVGSECPVCLSVFAEGEEVKQLSVCKHSFHATCIDMWLNSHSSCPVCRASIAIKRPNGTASARDQDRQQSSRDASGLV